MDDLEETLKKAKRRFMQYAELDEEEIDRFIDEIIKAANE